MTILDVVPPIDSDTGTALPFIDAVGTKAFTWYRPTAVGERPEKLTVAETPPTVSVVVVVVTARGLTGAAAPLAGWFVTGPRPVQKISMYVEPGTAGFEESTIRYEGSVIAPCPCAFIVKIPGEKAASCMVCGALVWLLTVAVANV